MTPRARLIVAGVGVLALAGAVIATIAASSQDDDRGAVVEGPRSPFKGALRPAGLSGDFALRNQAGEVVRTSDLRGRAIVVTPAYTTCLASCRIALQEIRGVLDDLPDTERARVRAFAVSVDPDRDTQRRAREFLRSLRVGGYVDYLLGTRAELRPVWRRYGFASRDGGPRSSPYIVLVDVRGRQRIGFPLRFATPEAIVHDLRLLLRAPAG
jgi:protein SCO1